MNNCPGTDALATIASALDWDVENGVRHLSSCADCTRQLHALQLTHDAYEERVDVTAKDVNSIMSALAKEAERERTHGRRAQKLGDVIEAVLAGATAVTVVSASGAAATGVVSTLTFAAVATALFAYRAIRSNSAAVLLDR